MILSQASKYALRATIHLARNADRPQLARDIAAALDVPSQYLAKILQDLARHGILTSAKGRGGGFRLAKSAAELELISVVRAIEGQNFGEGCVLGLPECGTDDPCPLHNQWGAIRESLIKMLEQTQLSNLSPSSNLLQ
ncbi:MAG: Rrf2 family transcriptional regulator [Gemmatimonadetes bacterium]|jgi:Rrf2 family transcriptional regulator, iron-sulfur cluster assembly transcription factor|nr:Rrf2 family transcriptional regulator [Gemmatimonadota bacterium]MBT6146344.1 Rrf2 family transcriptional regulator [Gemmatimonadota bacterium]MBT7858920.1 Rrf2 family transcriptional regulator [Gemmatimonadota bacterium]